MFSLEFYQSPQGNCPLKKYIKQLTKQHKEETLTQLLSMLQLLGKHGLGLKVIQPKAIKYIKDQIYELRPLPSRVFFFTIEENRIIILNAFEKKTQKTPKSEIEIAESYKKDYLKRI